MRKIFIISILLLSLFLVNSHQLNDDEHHHECIHEEIAKEFQPTPDIRDEDLEEGERIMTRYKPVDQRNAKPLRTHFVYENLHDDRIDAKHITHIKKILTSAGQYLNQRLSVNRISGHMKFPSYRGGKCYQAKVPSHFTSTGYSGADLVIFVTAKNEPQKGYAAWATSCVYERSSGRPIFGQINFNIQSINHGHDAFNQQVATATHEIIHVLGFSGGLYKNFIDEHGNRRQHVTKKGVYRGANGIQIQTPRVIQAAKNHFKCNHVTGVELENDGGSGSLGSHWEKVILYNEMMTAVSAKNTVISEFTLAILQDSGWYKVNFDMAHPISWGKGKGCKFLNEGCKARPMFDEFCAKPDRESHCLPDGNSFGYCGKQQFTTNDNCYTRNAWSNGHCKNSKNNNGNWKWSVNHKGVFFGPNSKCAVSSIIDSGYVVQPARSSCFKHKCMNGKIIYDVGGMNLVCTRKGQRVKSTNKKYNGELTCPDPKAYCNDDFPACPNHCSGVGFCHRGKCLCNPGFTGSDCSKTGKVINGPVRKPGKKAPTTSRRGTSRRTSPSRRGRRTYRRTSPSRRGRTYRRGRRTYRNDPACGNKRRRWVYTSGKYIWCN